MENPNKGELRGRGGWRAEKADFISDFWFAEKLSLRLTYVLMMISVSCVCGWVFVYVYVWVWTAKNLTSFLIDISHGLSNFFAVSRKGRHACYFSGMNFNKFIHSVKQAIAECGSVLRLAMAKEYMINPSAFSRAQSAKY